MDFIHTLKIKSLMIISGTAYYVERIAHSCCEYLSLTLRFGAVISGRVIEDHSGQPVISAEVKIRLAGAQDARGRLGN